VTRPTHDPHTLDRTRAIRAYYEPRIIPGRASHEVLDWASASSQQERFRVLVDNVELAGRSLLDVGSGLGDLLAYLRRQEVEADYTGVDLVEKMVHQARQRFPNGRFLQADVFADPCPLAETWDVVFCSGMLNLNLGNNEQFLPRALARFVALADEVVVFNLLHQRMADQQHLYQYNDPGRVGRILADLPVEARLVDDYLPNDFTFICHKR
jgi:SAM-dependent methyltransferase